jgi:hypothetical protein
MTPAAPVTADNQIVMYFHCGGCLSDCPPGISPGDWARIEVGWTQRGLQVRCRRCDRNIMHIDFEGRKHPANTSSGRKTL